MQLAPATSASHVDHGYSRITPSLRWRKNIYSGEECWPHLVQLLSCGIYETGSFDPLYPCPDLCLCIHANIYQRKLFFGRDYPKRVGANKE